MHLAIRAYLRFERSKFVHLPSPEEIGNIPDEWEKSVLLAGQLIQFQRDGIPKDDPKPPARRNASGRSGGRY